MVFCSFHCISVSLWFDSQKRIKNLPTILHCGDINERRCIVGLKFVCLGNCTTGIGEFVIKS